MTKVNGGTQRILAINSDKAHNNKHPKPLPNISGVTCKEVWSVAEDKNELGVITIGISLVKAL